MKKLLYSGVGKFLFTVLFALAVLSCAQFGLGLVALEFNMHATDYLEGWAVDKVRYTSEIHTDVDEKTGELQVQVEYLPEGIGYRAVTSDGQLAGEVIPEGARTTGQNIVVYTGLDEFVLLEVFVRTPPQPGDAGYGAYHIMRQLTSQQGPDLSASLLVAVLVAFLSFCALIAGAGRVSSGELKLASWHRIPFDLYLVLTACSVAALCFIGATLLWELTFLGQISMVGLVVVLAAAALILLSVCVTFAARFKAGGWWRNTLIYKLLRLCWRAVRGCCSLVRQGWELVSNLPALLLVGGGLLLLMAVRLPLAVEYDYMFPLLVLSYAAEGVLLLWIAGKLKKLFDSTAALSRGQTQAQLNPNEFVGPLRRQAEALNNVGAGIQRAVEQQTKSDRMRVELISNVSHDLKTPLTSIVSYVDLLQKEEINNPKAQEYLEVLSRQSNRLRRMTEDLIYVSRASTGNVEMRCEVLDVCELLQQTAGEFRGRFEQANLQLVLDLPQQALVTADSRSLARVMDNLMQNALLYSLPGSRVYLSVLVLKELAVVGVKNVSRDMLNVSPQELMERFVRGDSSRHTEGSGLGLSIAQSLMQQMGGELVLALDGDLFKALVRLPLATAEAVQRAAEEQRRADRSEAAEETPAAEADSAAKAAEGGTPDRAATQPDEAGEEPLLDADGRFAVFGKRAGGDAEDEEIGGGSEAAETEEGADDSEAGEAAEAAKTHASAGNSAVDEAAEAAGTAEAAAGTADAERAGAESPEAESAPRGGRRRMRKKRA